MLAHDQNKIISNYKLGNNCAVCAWGMKQENSYYRWLGHFRAYG